MSGEGIRQIRERLDEALHPTALEVIDEGHLHVGHAGEGQGHYRVRITCAAFTGKTPIQRHRLVYDALDDLMGDGIHALAIEATP
ncbi:MAG TPA: BolA family protein [Oleiagrimonas sp.]|nr:BolA family protein [Oleiagrimonas sp.]